jgi:undecaprenyl-diphosphatase
LALLFRSTKVTLVLYFWSLTTTYTRLYLGVHYLGDVIVGFIVGFILGSLFYVIYKQLSKRIGHNKLVSEQFTATGYLKSDLNAFLSVVYFNYICVIIVAMTRGF